MLKLNYFLADIFILSAEKQPIKLSWRKIEWLRLKTVKKVSASPYVVGSSEHSKEPRSYRDYFSRLLKRLDIPQIVFHGLRHTFATRCIESQCDYKTVSVILGHSNVSTTLNLYVHPNLTQKKKCVERMSKFLGIAEL